MKEINLEEIIFDILSDCKCDREIEYLQTDGTEELQWMKDKLKSKFKDILELASEEAIAEEDDNIYSGSYKINKESITNLINRIK